MTNTEIWLDEIVSHIQSVKSDMWMLREIMSLPNCNDCKRKDCSYKPKWGEHIRYNCPLHNADRKTENCSEKPNNCEYAKNPSGDVWECGCFLDTYCEHQIYDRNPDGTINIVECGNEPKDEPQTEMPRCSVNGTPYDECGFCEYFNCEADVPQAERR